MALEKYVPYQITESNRNTGWNMMTFYDMKVINVTINQYEKAGKRMSIELEAPKLRKKYYLYAWEENGLFDAIQKSGLRIGDNISCHAELSYYKDKDGRYCEAYRIVADADFYGSKETPRNFKLMRIRRDVVKQVSEGNHLSKEDLLKMMLGD